MLNRFAGRRLSVAVGGVVAVALAAAALAAGAGTVQGPRRPQALALVPAQNGGAALEVPGEELLLVGNRSGSVSVIRAGDLTLLGETPVGDNITDLEPLGDGAVVAVDHERHALVLLRVGAARGDDAQSYFPTMTVRDSSANTVEVKGIFPICRYPMRAVRRGTQLAVSCLWSRSVLLYDLDEPDGLAAAEITATLPFEARELVFLDDEKLLVADAFAGGLALVATDDGEVLGTRELSAHNLHGLALLPGGQRVAVAHQELHSGMRTTSDDIRWGVFITNSVSVLPVDDLVSGSPRLARRTQVMDLGDVRAPSGDPAEIVVGADGSLVVALSGVGRLALGNTDGRRMSQMPVGRGPTALAGGEGDSENERRVYVANTRSDSVSVVSLAERREIALVPLGPPASLNAVQRGELLFHDASLSLRGWMSCASCHTAGHTNHRLSDTLGDGTYGAPKRVLSLLGVRETRPWAWDGQIRNLEDQVVKSVRTTLRGRTLSEGEVHDLAAYLRTLELPEVPPKISDATSTTESGALLDKGQRVFNDYSCNRCHRAPLYTSPGVHDVGLTDERGNTRFNAPSLRGVRYRRRLLHDGRAGSLEEVLRVHPGHGVEVSEQDLAALIAFLRTL